MSDAGNDPNAAYSVDVLLNHPNAIVSKVQLAPGAETPVHAHQHDYVVHPQAASTLVKTTYQNGAVIGTETIEHKPNEPYFVFRSANGTSFSLKNVGASAMLCDKTQIPPSKAS